VLSILLGILVLTLLDSGEGSWGTSTVTPTLINRSHPPGGNCADRSICVSARNVLDVLCSTLIHRADARAAFEAQSTVSGILIRP
jgi:hypothetical protein